MGIVFSIEEFSVFDGPGIRTTVFLKGCPLSCTWCHNPEGQNPRPETVIREFSGEAVSGVSYTAEELYRKVMKNGDILKNGGVTFSGGEPLSQADFLCECLALFQGKLHTAVQTSGYAPKEVFRRVMERADYFLYDLKLLDGPAHEKWCGQSNEVILENLKLLAESGKNFIVRTPLIPGVTDTEENLRQIAEFLKANGIRRIELLPYNKMAGSKYKELSRVYEPGFSEKETPNPRADLFSEYGIDA